MTFFKNADKFYPHTAKNEMCRHSVKFSCHVMTWMLTARVKLWWRRMKVETFVDVTPSTEHIYLK